MPKHNLIEYMEKREFRHTAEPRGHVKKHQSEHPTFVIQKHDASHLHYDLRLEINGVLVSWAVPKGPPLIESERRLAIQTEDHPLEYAHFEGRIPEGNYGAGTVKIWDKGTFFNIKEKNGKLIPLEECLKQGQLEVFFEGNKMNGPYALIKTKMSGKDQWLLLKMKQ